MSSKELNVTEGEWEVIEQYSDEQGHTINLHSETGECLAYIHSLSFNCFEKHNRNFTLMAAAPELYEALEVAFPVVLGAALLVLADNKDAGEIEAILDRMKAALAKARGESNE